MSETKTPVALIFFRRFCVLEVLQQIRVYAPERLFLIADGGRTQEEHAQCQKIRKMVEMAIDWPCHVERLYSDKNLGCRGNSPRGISWVFSKSDRAIIIEDDSVASLDFFLFCEEMLSKYAQDDRVMAVSGTNYFPEHQSFGPYSYAFSQYFETPAYATWERGWRKYDADMKLWPAARASGMLRSGFLEPREQEFWERIFEETWDRSCKCDPYDTQWLFTIWLNRGLCIVPRVNLVTNIGGGPDATHTKNNNSVILGRPVQKLAWPLHHPPVFVRNKDYDQAHGRFVFYGEPPGILMRFRHALGKRIPVVLRRTIKAVAAWS